MKGSPRVTKAFREAKIYQRSKPEPSTSSPASPISPPSQSHKPDMMPISRYIENEPGLLKVVEDQHREMLRSLNYLIKHYPTAIASKLPSSGLHHGPLSSSFLSLTLSRSRLCPSIEIDGKLLKGMSAEYLSAYKPSTNHPQPLSHSGHLGVHDDEMVYICLRACLIGEVRLVEQFCAAAKSVRTSTDHTHKWLYAARATCTSCASWLRGSKSENSEKVAST